MSDRSILDSGPFIQANVIGTQVLLDVARAKVSRKFLQVSTDEVYGTLPEDAAGNKIYRRARFSPTAPTAPAKPPPIAWCDLISTPSTCPC